MSSQKSKINYSEKQGILLDLEKKYFNFIKTILDSPEFLNDLKKVETNIQNNYDFLSNVWNLKNKLKIPAERLLRYYIYKNEQIVGFFPSPVSGDLAVEVTDAIINLDIKTIDIVGNAGDIETIQFEHNQTSFLNKNVLSSDIFTGFKVQANLPTIDSFTKKPILTYLVKIIYSDNKTSFNIFNQKDYPLITLTCLPNGELSDLFDNDLFSNVKDYNYYKKSDGNYYNPKYISSKDEYDSLTSYNDKVQLIKSNCQIDDTWKKTQILNKVAFYDASMDKLWVTVLRRPKNSKPYYELNSIASPGTCRFNHIDLVDRYDSKNNPWKGIYKKYNSISPKEISSFEIYQ